MPLKKRIKYSPAAVDDKDEVFSYISQENVTAAGNMLEQLDSQIKLLLEFPHMGAILAEDEYPLVVRDYLRELFDSFQ